MASMNYNYKSYNSNLNQTQSEKPKIVIPKDYWSYENDKQPERLSGSRNQTYYGGISEEEEKRNQKNTRYMTNNQDKDYYNENSINYYKNDYNQNKNLNNFDSNVKNFKEMQYQYATTEQQKNKDIKDKDINENIQKQNINNGQEKYKTEKQLKNQQMETYQGNIRTNNRERKKYSPPNRQYNNGQYRTRSYSSNSRSSRNSYNSNNRNRSNSRLRRNNNYNYNYNIIIDSFKIVNQAITDQKICFSKVNTKQMFKEYLTKHNIETNKDVKDIPTGIYLILIIEAQYINDAKKIVKERDKEEGLEIQLQAYTEAIATYALGSLPFTVETGKIKLSASRQHISSALNAIIKQKTEVTQQEIHQVSTQTTQGTNLNIIIHLSINFIQDKNRLIDMTKIEK